MADLTKEEKKALRKEKFKSFLKIFGVGFGIAAVSGGVAYVIGRNHGQLAMMKSEVYNNNIKNARGEGVTNFLNIVADKLEDGHQWASKLENVSTGEVKYLNYTLSETKPDWWDDKDAAKYAKTSYEIVNDK